VLNVKASASELAFIPNTLSAPAGRIELRMTNPSQLQHSIALAVANVAPGAVVGYGGVSIVVATFAPGTYTYYSTVPGDRQAGMYGTLTVH
jgi:plastocyanin